MASSGTGKRNKTKWKPSNVDHVFDISATRKINWADEVEDENGGKLDTFDLKPSEKVVLPTAPRASCAAPVDESKIPMSGPFHAHISNIPYEVLDDELTSIFEGLNVKEVRVPREERGGNRARGFAYIEFNDRSSLISALQMGETLLKGRQIRIELASDYRSARGRGNQRGDMGPRGESSIDRTSGNWRSRSEDVDDQRGYDRPSRGYGGGGFSRGGDSFERFGSRDDRGPSRDDRSFRDRDRDRGGGGSSFGRSDGGSFGRSDGGSFGRSDRSDGGSFGRSDRSDGGSFGRSDRSDGGSFGRSDRSDGGSFGRSDRSDSSFGRSDRSDGGGSRFMSRRDDAPPPASSTESRTRPKIVLQPRSANLPPPISGGDPPPAAAAAAAAATTTAAAASTPSSSIFGNAKPVDTLSKYLEIEKRFSKPDFAPEKGRSSGSVSSIGSGSSSYMRSESQSSTDRKVEAPPPPRENAWNKPRNVPPASHVNNGRSSPSEEQQPSAPPADGEDRRPARIEPKKMDVRKPEI